MDGKIDELYNATYNNNQVPPSDGSICETGNQSPSENTVVA